MSENNVNPSDLEKNKNPEDVGQLTDVPFCESTPVPPPPPPGGRANMGRKRNRKKMKSLKNAIKQKVSAIKRRLKK